MSAFAPLLGDKRTVGRINQSDAWRQRGSGHCRAAPRRGRGSGRRADTEQDSRALRRGGGRSSPIAPMHGRSRSPRGARARKPTWLRFRRSLPRRCSCRSPTRPTMPPPSSAIIANWETSCGIGSTAVGKGRSGTIGRSARSSTKSCRERSLNSFHGRCFNLRVARDLCARRRDPLGAVYGDEQVRLVCSPAVAAQSFASSVISLRYASRSS
jgi:hypothetical protein